jgi:hypothetical protein
MRLHLVRIEIGNALERGMPVVPVLIDAELPDVDLLPDEIRELVDCQAEFVNYRTLEALLLRPPRNKCGVTITIYALHFRGYTNLIIDVKTRWLAVVNACSTSTANQLPAERLAFV